jgi:hypothetical protein
MAECSSYAGLSVQTIGYAERMLLEMEARFAVTAGIPASGIVGPLHVA